MAAQRDLAIDFFQHCIGVLCALHGREHISRSDRADPDLRGQLECHGFREFNHSGLGRVVVSVIWIAHDAVSRGGLQDHSATPLPHMPGRSLGYVEDAGEIDGKSPVPLFGSDVEEVVADAYAGVVDEDVNCAHEPYGFAEGRLDLLEMRDVRGDRAGHARQISSNLLASFGVAIQHNHVRAFFQKAGRSGGTDAAGAAGDENSLAVKTSHEGVRIQFVVVEEKLAMVGAYKKAFNRKDRKIAKEPRRTPRMLFRTLTSNGAKHHHSAVC